MKINAENMSSNWKNGVCYLTFPAFEKIPFVRHAFSTRIGGVSENEFASMNLSFGRGDSDEKVRENYRRFCGAAGFTYDSLISSAQVHGRVIRRVGRENRGEGFTRPKVKTGVDGLVTNEPGVTLVTHYADCVPLFFADPKNGAVGLAHSGWRGPHKRSAVPSSKRWRGSSAQGRGIFSRRSALPSARAALKWRLLSAIFLRQ